MTESQSRFNTNHNEDATFRERAAKTPVCQGRAEEALDVNQQALKALGHSRSHAPMGQFSSAHHQGRMQLR